MMIALRHLRRALLLLPLLVLTACNTVGEGNKIETLTIQNITGQTVSATVPMTQCLRYNFVALGTFTDGSSAYYTDRATWISSNPAVARVSNGDIQLPSNSALVYPKGTVIPMASSGTATITVDYVGVKASFNVSMSGAPSSITLLPNVPLIPRPAAGNQNIAPRTLITYTALANIGGRMTDITSVGVWSIVGAGTTAAPTAVDSIALFVTGFTSSFKGVAGAGGTVTVQTDFNSVAGSCPLATPTTSLTVAPMQSLALSSEFGANPPALIVGTTDRIKAIATLQGGVQQDVSELAVSGDGTTNAVTYLTPTLPSTRAATTPTISTVMGYRFIAPLVNLLFAVAVDGTQTGSDQTTVDLQAKFVTVPQVTDANGNITTQEVSIKTTANPPLTRTLQTGTLTKIDIAVINGSNPLKVPSFPQYAEDGARLQLQAIGTFTGAGGAQIQQDITRSVTWTSTDNNTVFVINSTLSASQAGLAVAGKAGAVAVNAAFTDASTTPSTVTTSNTLTLLAQ